MKDFFLCDCPQNENKVIVSSFVVASKQVKPRKTGELYLALILADRSGQIEAKMWDNVTDAMNTFEEDDVLKVKGLINKYKNRFQLTIHKLRRLEDADVDFTDYLPKTNKNIDELWQTLAEYVASFQDANLKNLVRAFMDDPAIAAAYKQAPAAKALHHAYIGGLLDHVVSLFKLCDLVSRNYPQVSRDLVLTGAFLHDIGKIHELSYSRSFSYTTRGQLLGHMIIELEMLHDKLAAFPDFPQEMKVLLEHLIISHHGEYEFGSPKLPMFPEALLLHYCDDLDSKMESMRAHFERESASDEAWTGSNPSLGRPLLNKDKYLSSNNGNHASSPSAEEPQPAPIATTEQPQQMAAAVNSAGPVLPSNGSESK
jgi:3'-5' exoribonuclease